MAGEDAREGLTAIISAKVPNPQFEGQKLNEYVDHLHWGFGLHVLGGVLKNNFPETYYKLPLGTRLLFSLGGIIQADDMYQHLYLQERDRYNPYEGRYGHISKSPLHRYYNWSNAPERNDQSKVMLHLLELGRFHFSAGYYQGPAYEMSMDILHIWDSRICINME